MWQEMTSCHFRWLEVIRRWRNVTGSHQEEGVEGQKLVYWTFHFLEGCSSQEEAVTWQKTTTRDLRWPEVTSFDWKSPGSGCRRSKTCVYCTFHYLQGSSSQEEAVTWQEIKSRELRWLEVTSFDRKSPGSGCRRPKTRVYWTFHFLQGCSAQEEAVTWQKMTSRKLRWPEVARKWRHLIGSHQEVAVENQKLLYTVHFSSYKPVARRKRQSRYRKSHHVTSGDRKWPGSGVIWPEVTWKWL